MKKRAIAILLMLCMVTAILPVTASAFYVNHDVEGTFSSFEELKKITSEGNITYGNTYKFTYVGNDPLIIEEDLTISGSIDLEISELIVPENVTFTTLGIHINTLIVDGTMICKSSTNVTESLEINGSVINEWYFSVGDNVDISAAKKIVSSKSNSRVFLPNQIIRNTDVAALQDLLYLAEDHPDFVMTIKFHITGPTVINESLTVPNHNVVLEIRWDEMQGESFDSTSLTIAEDTTLTGDGLIFVYVPCKFEGTLHNNYGFYYQVDGFREKLYTLEFTGDGSYAGTGELSINHMENAAIEDVVIGLDLNRFRIVQDTVLDHSLWLKKEMIHTHTWDAGTVTTPASCTSEGVKTFTCGCGETKTEAIPTTAHTEVIDDAVPSTCNATGLTEGKHCNMCNAVLVKQEIVPVIDHSYANGTCTVCGAADPDWELECTHEVTAEENAVEADCVNPGYTGDTICDDCGEVLEAGTEIPALGHKFAEGVCVRCGESNIIGQEMVERVAGGNRFDTAFAAANKMKEALDIEKFDSIIVTYGANFPDALSGSYLATVKNAPILLSFNENYNNLAKDYIKENLNPGGTVYLLGGSDVVPDSLGEGLDDFTVKRVAGDNRFDTNLEVLWEAGTAGNPILVCTGLEFADSLSASATELPILLVWNKLTEAQKEFLSTFDSSQFYIIGGENAVSKALEEELNAYGTVERVAGKNRFETSVAIAEKFFETPENAVLAYAWNYPDGLCGGPLAAAMDAPLILTMTNYESTAMAYIQSNNITAGTVLGSSKLISEDSVQMIFNQ